jgi:hypothetical protein
MGYNYDDYVQVVWCAECRRDCTEHCYAGPFNMVHRGVHYPKFCPDHKSLAERPREDRG